ncbi:CDP-glycerol glycerophosphotransferase family protein [Methanonatronarchaeum sp. AMET6-2]|uniref:CDP-glycerol glycerophosphotransferase family protein n=1 Tax=Methanonatronarchaeum sp. AMET6-2 TaxID=2933293 RepID=UPI00353030A0
MIFLSKEIYVYIYPVLDKVSLLITDYSSIYFDYYLLDRPIFYTFDFKEYFKNRITF